MNDSFYGSGDYYLEHHGIKGQKWGKKNGPPYPLSEAKHDKVVEKAKSTPMPKEKESASSRISDKDVRSSYDLANSERMTDVGKIGVKAMKKLGILDQDDTNTEWDIEWFMWEDQTIGLPMVTDLVMRGYDKKQIMNYLAKKGKNYDLDNDSDVEFEANYLTNGEGATNFIEKFIDACAEAIEETKSLSHHGILGMKWGKKNGPPYPLSEAKHDKVVEKAKKRKNKIANDAKQLYKHKEEFTTDEMYEAINKIRANNVAKDLIPKKKKKYKPVKLKGAKKKWAKDINTLSKHLDDYTPEEFGLAKEVLGRRVYVEKQQEDKFQRNLTKAKRPLKILKLGADYLAGLVSGKDALKKMMPYNPNELTDAEKHQKFLVSNGFAFMSKYSQNLNDLSKNDVFRGSILGMNPVYQQSYNQFKKSEPKKKTEAEIYDNITKAMQNGSMSSLPINEQKQFLASLATQAGREDAAAWLGMKPDELEIDPKLYGVIFGGGGKRR